MLIAIYEDTYVKDRGNCLTNMRRLINGEGNNARRKKRRGKIKI